MLTGTSSEEGVGLCFAICERLLQTKVCVCACMRACVRVCVVGRIAKWLGHRPGNQKVPGLIPG